MTNDELLRDLKARLEDMANRVCAGPSWRKLTCRQLYSDNPAMLIMKDADLEKRRAVDIKKWCSHQRNLIGYLQEQILRMGGEL